MYAKVEELIDKLSQLLISLDLPLDKDRPDPSAGKDKSITLAQQLKHTSLPDKVKAATMFILQSYAYHVIGAQQLDPIFAILETIFDDL